MKRLRLFAASYGHFSIDFVNASVVMVLTAVSTEFGLSISQIAFGALLYQMSAAMSQPLFGSITDRLKGRWIGPLGLLWTLVCYMTAMSMPSYTPMIALLMVGGMGSGAFHAAGLLNASVSGGRKAATATSVFFVGGQTGMALGPIVAGIVLARYGAPSMAWVALCMVPAVIVMLLFMNDPLPDAAPRSAAASTTSAGRHAAAALIVTTFILLITLRSGTAQTFTTLLPKYFEGLGITSDRYGLLLGLFAFSGAVGTMIGGFLGDRVNRRALIFVTMLAATPFCWLMLHSTGLPFALSAILAGIFLSMANSPILVMTQEMAPKRRGLVGGLVLGFMFASGSAVAWIAGIASDTWGLEAVLSLVALMPAMGALVALMLPSVRSAPPASTPVVSTSAAAD